MKLFRLLSLIMLVCLLGFTLQASAEKIYFDNSGTGWSKVYVYCWSPTNHDWPGEEMTPTSNDNIWEYEYNFNGQANIIFNNGSGGGTNQTDDLTLGSNYDNMVFTKTGNSDKTLDDYISGGGGGGGDDPEPVTGDVFIYADVPSSWTNLYAYVYIDNNTHNADWPGAPMTFDEETGYWIYSLPSKFENNCYVIFCSNDNRNNRYPGNNEEGLHLQGTSMIYHHDGNHSWEEYTPPVIEPGDDREYTISFYNNVGWENVNVEITGITPNLDLHMASFLNSTTYDVSFIAPENYSLHCKFYTLVGSSKEQMTESFLVKDGHIYTISGDRGLKSEFDPNNVLPEKEYWIEPDYPTAQQKATLYFNRSYTQNSRLKNVDNIYLYPGLYVEGSETIKGAPNNWSNLDRRYQMTQSATNPDLFTLEFNPTIASWMGVDADTSYDRLMIIFRDASGNTKQYDDDLIINLRPITPVGEELGAVTDWEISDGKAIITSENGKIFLTPWSKEIIKVFTLRNSNLDATERESISVVDESTRNSYGIPQGSFSQSEDDNTLFFSVPGGVKVGVEKATSLLSFYNDNSSSVPTLSESTNFTNKVGNVSVRFNPANDKAFYGGGYNGNITNWEGNSMVMNNNQQGNWGQGQSLSRNICIPYYVSTEGYGVYFDDHTLNAKIYPSKNGSSFSSSSVTPVAYYYIGGGDMISAMQNYTRLTGLQELPPYWALGYITSKFSFATRQEAEEAVSKTKAINIPIDGIVFDIHWQTGNYESGTHGMGKLDWNTTSYPNPQEMMQNLRNQNVHSIAITEPYFTSRCGNYDFLKNNGYFADDHVNGMEWLSSDHVGLIDITNPDACEWFKGKYKDRTAEGIDSWWLDLGEPEKHDRDSQYIDGSSYDQIHNEYGLRWNKLAFDAVKEQKPEQRFITMPRAGTSGMQRYNAFPWTGDIARSWAGLAAQVPALVSSAMSGVSYLGSDIGGFSASGTNPDLYRRWVQLGVFYPSMRTHSSVKPEVWNSEYNSIQNDVRNAINLRYAYLPYTYTQSFNYSLNGTPIARPANYADSNKSVLANEIGSYMWGPDLFVAPVLNNSTNKEITFPEGDWLDMNNFNTVYSSHQHVNYNAPVSVIPHFMRRGSFIIRYQQDTFTSTAEADNTKYIIDYFATDNDDEEGSVGEFYDDDHQEVNPLKSNNYLMTRFRGYNSDNQSFIISISQEGNGYEGMPENRDYHFRIHDFKVKGAGNSALTEDLVKIVKEEYPQASSRRRAPGDYREESSESLTSKNSEQEVLNSDSPAYYHDTNNNKLYLKLPNVKTTEPVWLSLGQPSLPTEVESSIAFDTMTLTYGSGYLTYSAPENTQDLKIEIFSATGCKVASYADLEATGYASQLEIDMEPGVYIAKMTGKDTLGNVGKKTIKIIM